MEGKTSKFLQGCSSDSDSSQSLFLELPKYEQWSENNCASAWGVWLLTRAMPDPSLCSLNQCTRTVPKRFPDLSPSPLMLLSWGMCRIQWGRNITISSSQHFFPLGQLANGGVAGGREGESGEGVGGWKSSLWVMEGKFITGHPAVYPGWKGLLACWWNSLSSLGLTHSNMGFCSCTGDNGTEAVLLKSD